MSKSISTQKNTHVIKLGIPDWMRLCFTTLVISFFVFCPFAYEQKYYRSQRLHEVLLKYYTEDEIRSLDIHQVGRKRELRLSTGIVLSKDELMYINSPKLPVIFNSFLMLILLSLLDKLFGGRNIKFIRWCFSPKISPDYKIDTNCKIEYQWVNYSIYKEVLREKQETVSLSKSFEPPLNY